MAALNARWVLFLVPADDIEATATSAKQKKNEKEKHKEHTFFLGDSGIKRGYYLLVYILS